MGLSGSHDGKQWRRAIGMPGLSATSRLNEPG